MTTVIAHHEVEDRERWLASSKREEFFGGLGISVRTFLDPENPSRVAILMEVPDMEALQQALQTPEAGEAMQHDGVRPETLVVLTET